MSDATHEWTSSSAEQTRALGGRLGALLELGDVVGLSGELGAGKTELVRGIAEGAGVTPEQVSSPTFSIVASYRGRLPMHHADLYRLVDEDDLYATGFFDLPPGALIVEWAEKISNALPAECLRVTLQPLGDDNRRIRAEAFGARATRLLRAWVASHTGGQLSF